MLARQRRARNRRRAPARRTGDPSGARRPVWVTLAAVMYREPGATPPCERCERPSLRPCPCCRKPTCARHFVGEQMCTRCDDELYRYLRAPGGSPFVPLIGMLTLAVVASFTVPALAVVALIGAMATVPVWTVVRRRRRRARWFRIMRARGELPPPPDDEPPEVAALAAYVARHERADIDRQVPTSAPAPSRSGRDD